jgi:hypothetical protein
MNNKCPYHLIFDIDGTLVDSIHDYEYKETMPKYDLVIGDRLVFLRPHVIDLLVYCFNHFTSISLWTAASERWLTSIATFLTVRINERKQQEMIPSLQVISQQKKEEKAQYYQFTLLWGSKRCRHRKYLTHDMYLNVFSMTRQNITKPLKKIWRAVSRRSLGFSRHNTLIIDDTSSTYKDNYGNALPMPSFNIKDMISSAEVQLYGNEARDVVGSIYTLPEETTTTNTTANTLTNNIVDTIITTSTTCTTTTTTSTHTNSTITTQDTNLTNSIKEKTVDTIKKIDTVKERIADTAASIVRECITSQDKMLNMLQLYLQDVIYKHTGSVRHLNKRYWYHEYY